MKRKLLTLSLAIFTAVGLNAQVNIVTVAPTESPGQPTQLRAPNGTATHTTLRAHFIITAAELSGLSSGDIITSVGYALADGISGVANGNLEFFLENTSDVTNLKSTTWATAISTMTSVYNGVYNIPATATTMPVDVDFPSAAGFVYNGGGLYVAYDYVATAATATFAATYFANTDITGAVVMDAAATATAPAVLTQTSSFRPNIRFGKANPSANDMTVNGVRPFFGNVNRAYQATSDAFGYVTNTSNTTLTNVPVTLDVTGANTFSNTQTVATIAPGDTEIVTFTGIPTTATGTNTYIVSVPTDDILTNNSDTTTQVVSCSFLSYAPITPITGGLGYNTGTGSMAIALDVPASSGPAFVKSVIPTISDNAAAAGNSIKGLLFNSTGTIIDSTANYSITTGDLENQVTLEFLNGAVDYAGQSLFVGFRQNANANTGYFPCATSDQFLTFPNTYYTIGANGGTPTAQTGFGAFLIDAEVSFGEVTVTSNADANGDFCASSPVVLTAMPAGLDSYNFVVGGSSVQNTASNTYTYSPAAASTYSVTGDLNGCTSATTNTTINPVTQYTSSFSENLCTGDSFTFGSQTLTAGGTYNETFTSVGGCDSVVTLTLAEITIDPTVTMPTGVTMVASYVFPGTTYQWVDCDNGNAAIPGAVGSSYTPTAATGIVGNYAVIISRFGCTATSACTTVDFTSVTEANGASLSVYPSPTSNVLNINTNLTEVAGYTIYDIEGRIVLDQVMLNNANLSTINVEALEAGTYIIEVKSSDASARKIFVKN